MTVIEEHADCATLINIFTVKPEHARQLVELLNTATTEVMQDMPGFISANIHLSLDGMRVVNYAQWQTAEDFQAMMQDPRASEHLSRCAAIASAFDPHLYDVEAVHVASAQT
ncbi:antibiotic biosynthesis monooxygenase [Nocardia colli]|uniref:Antibiotic biosynthesis monooxygenase n=1 Tax=Nocardia colli TaxID=2545717 RepID=A0A5N0E9V5_9NOCA|nr:antibiotic biosynthesis monooxygenase family protein [Nocardia colli]KAA8886218.1 antibiotic biosynthesis monooxygenase [Nocardia colli]